MAQGLYTDLSGVLTAWIQQPCDQSPQYADDSYTMVLEFKTAYSIAKDKYYIGWKFSDVISSDTFINAFPIPVCPKGKIWYVNEQSVRELEAGEHAIVRFTCIGKDEYSEWKQDSSKDNWSVQFLPYTVEPEAFCGALSSAPDIEVLAGDANNKWAQLTGYADPIKLAYWAQLQHAKGKLQTYADPNLNQSGKYYWLNHAEGLIANKIGKGVKAQYHYPLVSHTTVYESPLSVSSRFPHVVGEGIDTVVDQGHLSGCPFDFPTGASYPLNNWQWVKCGDQISREITDGVYQTVTRTEQFMGVISADPNFYGNQAFNRALLETCRWMIGKL